MHARLPCGRWRTAAPRLFVQSEYVPDWEFCRIFLGILEDLLLMPVLPVFTGPNGVSVGGQLEDGHSGRRGFVLALGRSFTHGCWRQFDTDCLARPLRIDLLP